MSSREASGGNPRTAWGSISLAVEGMKLGAGHPMGPLALLDLVGLDVAAVIGESIGADVPPRVRDLIEAGRLGRKSGAGFYDYEK